MNLDIAFFEKEVNRVKEQSDLFINPQNYVTNAGILFSEKMDFSGLNNEQLGMCHVLLHKWYLEKKSTFTRETIQKLHGSCVTEMVKKGISHESYDKLDASIG